MGGCRHSINPVQPFQLTALSLPSRWNLLRSTWLRAIIAVKRIGRHSNFQGGDLVISRTLNAALCCVSAAALLAVTPIAAATAARSHHASNNNTLSISETGASLAKPAPYTPPASARATIAAKMKMLDNLTHGRPQMLGVSLAGTKGLARLATDSSVTPDSIRQQADRG